MAKGTMIIDGCACRSTARRTSWSVIRKAGIDMPTFCYYSELSVYGACRMCIVEDVKTGKNRRLLLHGAARRAGNPHEHLPPAAASPSDPRAAARLARLQLHHLRQERQLPPARSWPSASACGTSASRIPARALPRTTPAMPSSATRTSASSARLRARVRGAAGTGHPQLCLPRQRPAGHARL